jgi:hypothetical protein
MSSSDRYVLTWEPGLCYDGCGQPLANPRRKFINGHDGKLMDLLVEATQADAYLTVKRGEDDPFPLKMVPRNWAVQAFSERGVRHFDWLLTHPGERPSVSLGDQVGSLWASGADLAADLETVRELVARAAEPSDDPEAFSRLEDELLVSRHYLANAEQSNAELTNRCSDLVLRVEELTAHADLAETELARLSEELNEAERGVTVTDAEVASLSDADVVVALTRRLRTAALRLDAERYQGDAGELWDLVTMFRNTRDPVKVAVARALLGQEGT